METLQNAVNWFEIPVTDFDRAKKFYSTLYDYEMPEMEMDGVKMGMFPSDKDKGVGGAIAKGEYYTPSSGGPKVYLNGGSDLNTILNRVEGAGGKILYPKTGIGEMGFIAAFLDTEGNHVSLHSMK